MKTDTATLTQIVQQCFDNAIDGRFSPADQMKFQALGKQLRDRLVKLLGAQFNDGTQAIVSANTQMANLNQALSNSAQVLANTATTLNNVTQLVGVLDGVLQLAVKVV
jgi:hypothetical protein